MTTRYSDQAVGVYDGSLPAKLGDPSMLGGRVHAIVGSITLAAQPSGDTIEYGEIPKGAVPVQLTLETDTSLGSATIAAGSTVAAAKYRAAAVFTAVDTPTGAMKTSAFGVATTAKERLNLTIGTAALPASGRLAWKFEYTLLEGG